MSNLENDRQLYEDEKHWQEVTSSVYVTEKINIIRRIIPFDVKSIGDIGCGNGIIANQLAENWWVVGVDWSWAALSNVRTIRLNAEINRLPFVNDAFDLILCSEVLEHLPKTILKKALAELSRVSHRYLLITVPNQEYLPKNYIKCPKCCHIFNAAYHLNSFSKGKLLSLFPGFRIIKAFKCGKAVRQYVPFLLKIKQQLANSWARFSAKRHYICPKCSFHFTYQENKNIISLICDILNRFLSSRQPYWLGVLLEKQGYPISH